MLATGSGVDTQLAWSLIGEEETMDVGDSAKGYKTGCVMCARGLGSEHISHTDDSQAQERRSAGVQNKNPTSPTSGEPCLIYLK